MKEVSIKKDSIALTLEQHHMEQQLEKLHAKCFQISNLVMKMEA